LIASSICEGDEVITTNLTAYPTFTGIARSGATPVVVDINNDDALINPEEIEKSINSKTKAIVPVHLYGQCCDMDSILAVAKKHGLVVLEDCAQSCGAEYKTKKAGTFGCLSAFSFYPTKNLGAYGDGGAIATNDSKLFEKLKLLRNYGQSSRFKHDFNGFNSRLDEIQAAILNVKLKHLDRFNNIRYRMLIIIKNI